LVLFYRADLAAEHIEANLLPCNAAVRLQAGGCGDVETLGTIKQEVVCGKSYRVLHTQQLPQKDKADPRGTTRASDRVRLIEEEIGLSTMCFKKNLLEKKNENDEQAL
jgi:hypothetical protein